MDPTSNLEEQLGIAKAVAEHGHNFPDALARLAELVIALDEWIRKGGCLPKQWQPKEATRRARG